MEEENKGSPDPFRPRLTVTNEKDRRKDSSSVQLAKRGEVSCGAEDRFIQTMSRQLYCGDSWMFI